MKTSNFNNGNESEIPKLLHFTWGFLSDSAKLPDHYQTIFDVWKRLHPSWEMRLNFPKDAEQLAAKYDHFPYFNYRRGIQRCDACRPMLMHQIGGVYTDLDVVPHQSLDIIKALYPDASVVFCEETTLSQQVARKIGAMQPIRNNKPELPKRVANYFMASKPGHPIWLEVLELMRQRSALPVRTDYDIIYTTGPDIISEIAHRAEQCYSDIVIIPRPVIDQIITHHRSGSWRS